MSFILKDDVLSTEEKVLYISEMFKLLNVFKYFELKNLSKVCFILPCMLKEYAEEDFTS